MFAVFVAWRPRRPSRRRSSAPSPRGWRWRGPIGGTTSIRRFRPVVDIFAPVFFVYVGAQVDVRLLNPAVAENRPALLLGLGLTVIGFLGKFAAGFCAWGKVRRAFIGAGMVPRGEVGLIFASLGLADRSAARGRILAVLVAVFATTFVDAAAPEGPSTSDDVRRPSARSLCPQRGEGQGAGAVDARLGSTPVAGRAAADRPASSLRSVRRSASRRWKRARAQRDPVLRPLGLSGEIRGSARRRCARP